jgi:hypothetical protein
MVGMAQILYFHPSHQLAAAAAVVQEITVVGKMAARAVAQQRQAEAAITQAVQAHQAKVITAAPPLPYQA